MGQTLTNGIYLPNEGERNCYSGLAANWNAVDTLKGNYSLHAINVDIHVTAAEKETWNGKADNSALTAHTGDTTIHVTSADKQAWDGHVADLVKHVTAEDKSKWNTVTSKADASALTAHTGNTTIHVTAEDKAKWDAVTSKADDSDVVHKSGDESVIGSKRFGVIQSFTGYPTIRLYSPTDDVNVLPSAHEQREIRFTDKNNILIAYFIFQHRNDANEPFRTCWRQNRLDGTENYYSVDFNNLGEFYPENNNAIKLGTSLKRWSEVYATNYYYGSNNVEFSTKFVTTDTNQTIHGTKTFNNHTYIYDPDATATTPNLYLRSSKIEISSQGNASGDQNLTYLDKNNTSYAYVKGAIQSNGSAVKIRSTAKDSSDNSVISELQIFAYTNGNKAIFPSYSNEIDLGLSNYKWKSFNGLEPSSLSLPSDRSARIDISSYITNLDNGNNNQYIVPANGYIWLHFTSINSCLCYSQTPGGLTNYAQTFARYSGDGQLYAFFPVRKNDYFIVQIYTSSTAVVQNAYFIPCQGNV